MHTLEESGRAGFIGYGYEGFVAKMADPFSRMYVWYTVLRGPEMSILLDFKVKKQRWSGLLASNVTQSKSVDKLPKGTLSLHARLVALATLYAHFMSGSGRTLDAHCLL